MSENVDHELARRLKDVAASVAGLSEDEAVEMLETQLKQVRANGLARHRLSLARARGTLANALCGDTDPDMLASLEDMVDTIERSGPADVVPLPSPASAADPASTDYDPELAGNLAELLACHHQNTVSILGLIAKTSVAGDDPELLATLDELLNYDLAAITELEGS
ncbi:hypothetical protein [Nocardioides nematodiphilus]|uniref:hypothetical protein n=1 Tax=Nocardioides nematodiphilus TaxID=2849669 RepID=UPI001CDA54D3|nr:hypothetical protein [Nocardioides nematodiphilus]MCA1983861.1 hypothetical protein [Nocardioides nematodiphilus]